MRLPIEQAGELVHALMRASGFDEGEAGTITHHLLDCELRGAVYGGLSRALTITETVRALPEPSTPFRVTRQTAVSAQIDGGNSAGYLVARHATELAIAKAQQHGIGVVAVYNTWLTGMFSYYMEMATRSDLVALAFGSSSWYVAPHGSNEARFGTNPIACGFPSTGDPVILDIGTSAMPVGEAVLRKRLGQPLPEGWAFGPDGEATCDPQSALDGVFKAWGGHKGAGLAMMVQMFGLLCSHAVRPPPHKESTFLIFVVRPDLFAPAEAYKKAIADYAESVRAARPVGAASIRMPFERSAAERRKRLADGWFEVPDAIHRQLLVQLEQVALKQPQPKPQSQQNDRGAS